MNNKIAYTITAIVAVFVLGLVFFNLNQENGSIAENSDSEKMVAGVEKAIPEGDRLNISTGESEVTWAGRKTLIPNYTDTGTLNIKEGYFVTEENELLGGLVVFDMNSIKTVSTGILKNEDRLTQHLKSEDFFSVESHPNAEFTINMVIPSDNAENENEVMLSGVLTVKGIDQNVSIPASVTFEDNGALIVEGVAELDRTLWDIRYGSDKFFDDLADNVIDDLFTVEFRAVAQNS